MTIEFYKVISGCASLNTVERSLAECREDVEDIILRVCTQQGLEEHVTRLKSIQERIEQLTISFTAFGKGLERAVNTMEHYEALITDKAMGNEVRFSTQTVTQYTPETQTNVRSFLNTIID